MTIYTPNNSGHSGESIFSIWGDSEPIIVRVFWSVGKSQSPGKPDRRWQRNENLMAMDHDNLYAKQLRTLGRIHVQSLRIWGGRKSAVAFPFSSRKAKKEWIDFQGWDSNPRHLCHLRTSASVLPPRPRRLRKKIIYKWAIYSSFLCDYVLVAQVERFNENVLDLCHAAPSTPFLAKQRCRSNSL